MGKSKELAVCLVSGGMDSLVTAAIANEAHEKLAFLHLNYGQKTEKRELDSFHKIAQHYHVAASSQKIIDISFLKQIGGSSLTDENIEVKKSDLHEITYSPFRDEFPNGNNGKTLGELLKYMVSQSDNNITDVLIKKIGGTEIVQQTLDKKGIKNFS